MKYPDIKTYEKIYKRYLLGDRAREMMDIAGDVSGKTFLDICCGGGRLTTEALKRGACKSIMIDSESKMIPPCFKGSSLTDIFILPVKEALDMLRYNIIDVAICQQAVNYWLTKATAEQLALSMPIGGVFVFNTFNQKPSKVPKVKEYSVERTSSLGSDSFVEISWMVENDWFDVHHVQICQGETPHFTKFKWLSEEYLKNSLENFFDIDIIVDGNTSIYKCVRK